MLKTKVFCIIILMCMSTGTLKAQDSLKSESKIDAMLKSLAERNVSLSTNIIELLIKGPNLIYEQSINGDKGITVKMTYDIASTVDMLYLEGSYRWYIWQPMGNTPLTGLAVGPYLKMTQQLSGKGTFTIGAGGEAAFKMIFYKHYVLEPSITLSYPYIFDLRIGFGYAF